jgi:hypothetical protein
LWYFGGFDPSTSKEAPPRSLVNRFVSHRPSRRFEPAPAILDHPEAGVKDVSRETSLNL